MDNPIWEFSLAHYARPGVAQACLRAQDELGLDVNILLYAAWLASRDQPLPAAHLAGLEQATVHWRREVVAPLRALRRQWRSVPGAGPLRERLKALELDAEKALQDAIWDFHRSAPPASGCPADLATNLGRVFVLAGPGSEQAALQRQLEAALLKA